MENWTGEKYENYHRILNELRHEIGKLKIGKGSIEYSNALFRHRIIALINDKVKIIKEIELREFVKFNLFEYFSFAFDKPNDIKIIEDQYKYLDIIKYIGIGVGLGLLLVQIIIN